jgi:hypothetical protein
MSVTLFAKFSGSTESTPDLRRSFGDRLLSDLPTFRGVVSVDLFESPNQPIPLFATFILIMKTIWINH